MKVHSILPQAELFIRNNMNMQIINIEKTNFPHLIFKLKDYSSMMNIDGTSINIKVVISFDTPLIEQIVKNFIGVQEIEEYGKEATCFDGSSEVMNIIFGLATPDYTKEGENIKLYPPQKVFSMDDVLVPKECSILHENIHTKFGSMSVDIIESIKH